MSWRSRRQGTHRLVSFRRETPRAPDGLSLVPWQNGKALGWDVIVICPLADSYISAAARDAGAAAELAASHKEVEIRG